MKLFLLAVASILVIGCGGAESEQITWPRPEFPTAVPTSGLPEPEPTQSPFATFPTHLQRDWSTDFEKRAVSPLEIVQGAAKDGIPAISEPRFLPVSSTTYLKELEPVVAFELNGDARAYPLQVLIWHEIVNDIVGGEPVLITFCPLCNTAIAFDRRVDSKVLEFGVSGFLRNSDLIMFDRATESWWQQIGGEGIAGFYTGERLELLPSSIVSWGDFRSAFPDGKVLSRNTGYSRPYGENPYVGYDDVNSSPFLFTGNADGRLQAMERVVTVEINGETAAYPFSRLEEVNVIHDEVGGEPIVVFFKPGTTSALDRSSIADSRDIGSAAAFLPEVAGRSLTFSSQGNAFADNETGSTWDIFGRATAGPLKGQHLQPVVSGNHFWFAWAAFKPETRVWQRSPSRP
jgi:hypothetical protein